MIFNKHSELAGSHAILSPSQPSWLYKTDEETSEYINNKLRAQRGTELHDYRHHRITLARLQPRNNDTVNMFINDAIRFRMESEQILFYSYQVYGTADAISFNEKTKTLRIHDLKTGKMPAKMEQLLVYAALFCLEYRMDPKEINTILNIYQNNEIVTCEPTSDEIETIMEQIKHKNELINEIMGG